jgi:protein phosphatase
MKVTSFGSTDPGKRRSNNEDAFLTDDELQLYAVADGIGGNEGGEVASRIAMETLSEAMPDLLGEGDRTPPSGSDLLTDPKFSALRQAVFLANRNILEERSDKPSLANMGTTLTALLIRKKQALLVNIGDSRAYLFRAKKLQQLSADHSLIAEYVATGVMSPEEAKTSQYRHVITRALGIADTAEADYTEHPLKQDDLLLLCTDGLTEMVGDAEISKILAGSAPEVAVQKLIAAANKAGGVDNITAVVVWVAEM